MSLRCSFPPLCWGYANMLSLIPVTCPRRLAGPVCRPGFGGMGAGSRGCGGGGRGGSRGAGGPPGRRGARPGCKCWQCQAQWCSPDGSPTSAEEHMVLQAAAPRWGDKPREGGCTRPGRVMPDVQLCVMGWCVAWGPVHGSQFGCWKLMLRALVSELHKAGNSSVLILVFRLAKSFYWNPN